MAMAVENIDRVKERLLASKRPVALTGAGISAESGVPTFRGADGLWKNFKAEELATPEAFQRDPRLVWEWYDWRRGLLKGIKPNRGHIALKELEEGFKDFTLITQNVDGLHSLAGNKKVLELHGSIWRLRCTGCNREEENRDVPLKLLPMCGCGGLKRPGVVWFGEMLPPGVLEEAFERAGRADFFLVVGTSGVVQPAASLALMAKREGAYLVEVNIERTPLSSSADAVLTGKAGEILPLLARG